MSVKGFSRLPYAPASALADLDKLTPDELADQALAAFKLGWRDGNGGYQQMSSAKLMDTLYPNGYRHRHVVILRKKLRQVYGAGYDLALYP